MSEPRTEGNDNEPPASENAPSPSQEVEGQPTPEVAVGSGPVDPSAYAPGQAPSIVPTPIQVPPVATLPTQVPPALPTQVPPPVPPPIAPPSVPMPYGYSSSSSGVFTPNKPIMGGLIATSSHEYTAWTGGKPKADWSGLDPQEPQFPTDVGQQRPNSPGSAQKSSAAREAGRDKLYSINGNLTEFREAIMEEFRSTGLDTITYLPDPLNPRRMLSVVEDHVRFNLFAPAVASAKLIRTKYDSFDLTNDKTAVKWLHNSLVPSLKTKVKDRAPTGSGFVVQWLVLLRLVESTSHSKYEALKTAIEGKTITAYPKQDISAMASDFLHLATELRNASQYEHRLTKVMLDKFLVAGGDDVHTLKYRTELLDIHRKLDKALNFIAHLSKADANEYMETEELTFSDICQAAETQWQALYSDGKWAPALTKTDSHRPPRRFAANLAATTDPVNPSSEPVTQDTLLQALALVANGFRCHNCDKPGHYARDCPEPKKKQSDDSKFSKFSKTGDGQTNGSSDFRRRKPDATWCKKIETVDGEDHWTTEQEGTTYHNCSKCRKWTTTHWTGTHTGGNKNGTNKNKNNKKHGKSYLSAASASDASVPFRFFHFNWSPEPVPNASDRLIVDDSPLDFLFPHLPGLFMIAFLLIGSLAPAACLWLVVGYVLGVGPSNFFPAESWPRWYRRYCKRFHRNRHRRIYRHWTAFQRAPGSTPRYRARMTALAARLRRQYRSWRRPSSSYFSADYFQREHVVPEGVTKPKPQKNRRHWKQRQGRCPKSPRECTKPWNDPPPCSPRPCSEYQRYGCWTGPKVWHFASSKPSNTSTSIPAIFSNADGTFPVIWDSGASVCLSFDRNDFVGPLRKPSGRHRESEGVGSNVRVEGVGHVAWSFEDSTGMLRTIKAPAVYVPESKVRLLATNSVARLYKETIEFKPDGTMVMSGSDKTNSIIVSFDAHNTLAVAHAHNVNSIPKMADTLVHAVTTVSESNINLSDPEKELPPAASKLPPVDPSQDINQTWFDPASSPYDPFDMQSIDDAPAEKPNFPTAAPAPVPPPPAQPSPKASPPSLERERNGIIDGPQAHTDDNDDGGDWIVHHNRRRDRHYTTGNNQDTVGEKHVRFDTSSPASQVPPRTPRNSDATRIQRESPAPIPSQTQREHPATPRPQGSNKSPVKVYHEMRRLADHNAPGKTETKSATATTSTASIEAPLRRSDRHRKPAARFMRTILKLRKSQYGTTIAPRLWYLHLRKALIELGFKASAHDPCFMYQKDILLVLYVDDCGLAVKDPSKVDWFVSELRSRGFELDVEGDFTTFLGVTIDRLPDGRIHMHQSALIDKIITSATMDDCNPNHTPVNSLDLNLNWTSTISSTVFEDNSAALILATNQRLTSRTKYFLTSWHHFWSHVSEDGGKDGKTIIEKCSTLMQRADYFTKGLVREPFERCRKQNQGW